MQSLDSKFKEDSGLRSCGDANLVFFQLLFGQAETLQQRRRIDTVIPKRGEG